MKFRAMHLATLLLIVGVAMDPGAVLGASYKYDFRRGHPGEYDPGPPKDSKWVELFGTAPNYRALGKVILGGSGEKFRWKFGPMWYRGRLGRNEVKVFVVGQEGAQDENVTNRAFTGSTGTKTQNFLNHLGLTKSYLFMNTFVYTINGQRGSSKEYYWMEQGTNPPSPIVAYRHSLFDNMARENAGSLQIVLGVGGGGKASLATWINARGGKCSTSQNLKNCDTSGMKRYLKDKLGINLKNTILALGVPHPGGASPRNGGQNALKNIIRGFTGAAQKVNYYMRENSQWKKNWYSDLDELEGKSGSARSKKIREIEKRIDGDYKYTNAPIPFRDFAFGTNWRMGDRGTTSNRRKAHTIQVFSAKGKYNNKGHNVRYKDPRDNTFGLERSGDRVVVPGMKSTDLAYESPKWDPRDESHAQSFDYGPCSRWGYSCSLSRLLQDWPDFGDLDASPVSHASFGHGPVYRGRFDGARVLVISDQYSHDDFFSARALTGEAGQKLQTLLDVSGAGSDYVILRTLPVDTLGLSDDEVDAIAFDTDIDNHRFDIIVEALQYADAEVVLAIGDTAKKVVDSIDFEGVKVLQLGAPFGDGHVSSWNKTAGQIADILGERKDGSYKGQLTPIPREDLPAHTRWWMGTTGTRAARGEGDSNVLGNYYKVYAPSWASKLRPAKLSSSELKKVQSDMRKAGLD